MGFPRGSHGKESACNAGDLGLIPELERSSGELGSRMPEGFLRDSVGKESACNAGDLGLIPGLGRSPGYWNGYPFQYSGLENPMNRGA